MHEHNTRDCDTPAIGGNHFGPVMVYLSKVDDAATADGSSQFFKIGEFGYDASTKKWGTDILNDNCGQFEVNLPSDIPDGDYLLRAEAIALHAAGQEGGAQFYMSCYVSKRQRSTDHIFPANNLSNIATQGLRRRWLHPGGCELPRRVLGQRPRHQD